MKVRLISVAASMLSVGLIVPLAHAGNLWLNACSGWTEEESVPAPGSRERTARPEKPWGWQLMTRAERAEYQDRMRGFRSYDDCTIYEDKQHRLIARRARAKGMELPPPPSGTYGCDDLKARGKLR